MSLRSLDQRTTYPSPAAAGVKAGLHLAGAEHKQRQKSRNRRELTDKPGSVVDNHSSGTLVTKGLKQPTRIQLRAATLDSYLVLLRVGFTLPRTVTGRAVRSYRTFSPLPANWRFIFCCTFRRLTPPRRYLALCPVEPGLSSTTASHKTSGCPANSRHSDCLVNSLRAVYSQ